MKSILFYLTIWTFTSVISSLSHAFTLTSANGKGFADPTITILVNQSSCPNSFNLRRVLEDAIKAWNGVPTSRLLLKIGDDTSSTTAAIPPVAYCDSTMTGGTLGQGGGSTDSNGTIVAGFLRVNTNSAASGYILNQSDTQQAIVVAHELGHMFGLGHTSKDSSLMNYSIGSKTDLGLSQDDIDGISYLYPRNELGADKMMGGCGTISLSSGRPKNQGPGAWSLFLISMACCLPLVAFSLLRTGGLSSQHKAGI